MGAKSLAFERSPSTVSVRVRLPSHIAPVTRTASFHCSTGTGPGPVTESDHSAS